MEYKVTHEYENDRAKVIMLSPVGLTEEERAVILKDIKKAFYEIAKYNYLQAREESAGA